MPEIKVKLAETNHRTFRLFDFYIDEVYAGAATKGQSDLINLNFKSEECFSKYKKFVDQITDEVRKLLQHKPKNKLTIKMKKNA